MEPETGDELVVDADRTGGSARVGTILATRVCNGHPEYLVHWVAGDYDALVSPWPGVHIERRVNLAATGQQGSRGNGSASPVS